MLPTAIRPGSPLLAVTSATATAAVPKSPASPHLVPSRPGDASAHSEALQSQERAAANDPKYRKYAAAVDKTLATFEHVNEWADFITFLAKLLKCLQSAPQYPFIPHKLTVAKRLSQCLNPALPTGVHQRALDVYTHILTTIGPDNLRRDLPAWTSGLLPFFQYAATSIKPMVLSILDRFYLPLQDALRPATKAFILALLPGLDEETGEWFEQVATLLDRLCSTVTPSFFLPTLWLVLITAPRSRVAALNYLSRRLPLLAPPEATRSPAEQSDRRVGLMVRAFAAALVDEQILVQRGVLDLLISTLPVHSPAYQNLPQSDRTLLARASLGVVLRRDLSLTRRLYTWLLGRSDGSEEQIEYFRAHALRDVHAALICEMDAAAALSGGSDTQSGGELAATPTATEKPRHVPPVSTSSATLLRPFKIFISLLDKWELGAPLTAVAVVDTFAAIQSILSPKSDGEVNDEVFLTAQLLYEAFDPAVLWRAVYDIAHRALQDEEASSAIISQLELVRYIVSTFRIRDGEAKALHAPLIAVSILRTVARRVETASTLTGLIACVELAHDLIAEIPPPATTEFASTSARAETGNSIEAVEAAERVYTGTGAAQEATMASLSTPTLLAEGLVATLDLIASSCRIQHATSGATSARAVPSRKVCLVATRLARRLFGMPGLSGRHCDSPTSSTGRLPWSASSWVRDVARAVESMQAVPGNFELHDALIRSVLDLHAADQLTSAAQRLELTKVFSTKLLDYLAADLAQCHLTAVELIWTVAVLSPLRTVETVVASRLESQDKLVRARGYEEFGNLWRFTPDQQLPGKLLRLPMFAILDGLKSDSLTERRLAEAWMRCSLKSYLRVLDPIFHILTNSALRTETRTEKLGGIRIPVTHFARPVDYGQIQHALDSLLSLARFGGQGFIRVAKTSFLKHTLDPSLRQQILHTELETCTYLDGLVVLLLRFLCAEPMSTSNPTADGSLIHAVTAEILQVLLSRGEAELSDIPTIEAALSSRLFTSVHRGEIDLQNKMLHVLHTVVHARSQVVEPVRASERRLRADTSGSPSTASANLSSASPLTLYSPPDLSRDEFFLRIVTRALEQSDNAVVHHWLDFLLMTVPHSHYDDVTVLGPLLDVLILRLRRCIADIELAFTPTAIETDTSATDISADDSCATDAEFAAIVNALERLLLLYTPKVDRESAISRENGATQRSGGDSAAASGPAGLLGYVTGVLGQAETDSDSSDTSGRRDTRRFTDAIAVLLLAWDSSLRLETRTTDVFVEARDHVVSRVRVRARRALDRLVKGNAADIADAVVHVWAEWQAICRPSPADTSRARDNLPGILHILFPSPAALVRALYESVPVRHTTTKVTSSDRGSATDGDSSLKFLDYYLGHIEPASIVPLWSSTLQFVREVVANQAHNRNLLLPTLRCLVTVAEKLAQTRALEDRRLRRDLQDTLSRLIDVAVQTAVRTPESSGWLRKAARETSAAEDEASISNETDASSIVEKERLSGAVLQKSLSINELLSFLATSVLPLLDDLQLEPDKVAAICTNISYYVVAPGFKSRSQYSEISPTVFQLLEQMTHQAGAAKVWKSVVSDGFSDHRFFQASPLVHRYWKPLVHALMSTDRDRIPELVVKVSTSSSANIFTNRELEVLSRALALRRVTYTLFCSPKDTFLTQLPAIQEKLVDLLRSPVGDLVQAEVYLCLRVLFCRIDNQHLAGLWPVILTELLRLFDSLLDRSVSDGSDFLQLVSAACKFLDLTLVLQTEDFQIHEWIFVTDTIDATRTTNSMPQAIIDRLGTISSGVAGTVLGGDESHLPDASGRRPLLTARRISSMSTLQPFLQNVSHAAYDSIYDAGTKIDWAAVEASIVADLFEGPSDSATALAL